MYEYTEYNQVHDDRSYLRFSQKRTGRRRRLVYALVESLSDTSFISETVYSRLGINGVKTSISILTMTTNDKVIDRRKIFGLMVRGSKQNTEEACHCKGLY